MLHSQTHLRSRPIAAGHLRAFEAVARHLNFRAAAEEMALTQSAVSQHVRCIEGVVGAPIVERSGRGMVFTELGHRVVVHARKILAVHDGALTDLGAAEEKVLLVGASGHPLVVPQAHLFHFTGGVVQPAALEWRRSRSARR